MGFDYAEFSSAFPAFFPTVAFLFGTLFGSFFNVVIYRLPAGKSVVRPRSHCACGQPIAWYDNIPIVSWFVLRGRARCCGRPYSFRYAFVELLTGALFLGSWLAFPPAKALCGMLLLSALVCATFIDLDHMIIPDVFTIGLGAVGVVLSFCVPALHGHSDEFFLVASLRSGIDSLQGLLIGSGLVLWIALLAETLLKKEAMGFGDVKFVGAIGAFCGWEGAVFSIFGGAIVGTVWFIAAKLVQTAKPGLDPAATDQTAHAAPDTPAIPADGAEPVEEDAPVGFGVHIPFGPMLAIAGAIYFLVAHPWVDAYFAGIRAVL